METLSAALIFFILALADASAQDESLQSYVINLYRDTVRGWVQSSADGMNGITNNPFLGQK